MEDLVFFSGVGVVMLVFALIFAAAAGKANGRGKGPSRVVAISFGIVAVIFFVIGAVQFRTESPTGYPQESLSLGVYKLEGSPQTYTEDDGTKFVLFFTEREDDNITAFRIRSEQVSGSVCAEAEFLEVWDNPQKQRTYWFVGCNESSGPGGSSEIPIPEPRVVPQPKGVPGTPFFVVQMIYK